MSDLDLLKAALSFLEELRGDLYVACEERRNPHACDKLNELDRLTDEIEKRLKEGNAHV
jgi:hypothetical protein